MDATYLLIGVYVFGVWAFLRVALKVPEKNQRYWLLSAPIILTWPVSMFGLIIYGFLKNKNQASDDSVSDN